MVGGSLSTTASSTTKSGRLDIAEILLKVALNTKNQIVLEAFNVIFFLCYFFFYLSIMCVLVSIMSDC